MVKLQSIVDFENQKLNNDLRRRIKSIPKFSDEQLCSKRINKLLVKKLGLEDKDYYKKFREEIFSNLKENSYVLVRGLPFDDNNLLAAGLTVFLGIPVIQYNQKIPRFVKEIVPRTGLRYDENFPHTDGVYWPDPNDIIALQCVRKDQNNGGLSRIVSIDNALETLKKKGFIDVIKRLSDRKFPFTLDSLYGKSGIHMQHILTRHRYGGKNFDHVRFLRHEIQHCVKEFRIRLRKATIDAVLTFENEVIKLGKKMEFPVNEGEWILVDNKRALHSRSQTSANSKRLLKRIKFNIDRENVFQS